MAFSVTFKRLYMLNILILCLCTFVESQDIFLDEASQNGLKFNSVPEISKLLYDLPITYDSSEFVKGSLDFSKLNIENGSSVLHQVLSEQKGKCSDDIIQLLSNIKSPWALQMLDSSGKLSSGVLRGSLLWTGHYQECLTAYAPSDGKDHGDFHGQYCVSSWTLGLNTQFSSVPLTIGLCVPDSCLEENLKTAFKNISNALDYVPFVKNLKSYLTLNDIVCKGKERTVDAPSILYLCIVSIFIILTVIGSSLPAIDYWKSNYTMRQNLLVSTQVQNYGSLNIQKDVERELSTTFEKESTHGKNSTTEESVSTLKRILLCFSIFSNGQKVLNVERVEGQLLSIHGIRFLSLAWVILGHTLINSVSIIENKLDVLKRMDTFGFQMLLQTPFSVDSFFLLSGFLLTYLFLKEADKKNGKINWVQFYLHRIWRLTPPYLTVVFFYLLIFKYVGSGPFWDDNQCNAERSSWWKYILYINNFIPIHQMCVGWSWYLANDMQFYVISPLILYPLWKWPAAGFAVIGSVLFATWTTTGIMSYKFDIIPMFVGVTQTNDLAAYQDRMWNSFDLIYDKPYCRIAPYIIGIILGYILHKTADRKDFLTWWQQLLGWIIGSFCALSVIFGLYHVEMPKTLSLFYNSLSRTSFAIGVAWVIYACETGHGGFVTKLLSWKVFVPLSRLTYCTYLIHPIIIHGYYNAYQKAFYFTLFVAITHFMGFLLISFGIAFIFSLVYESPFMNLEKLFLKRKAH